MACLSSVSPKAKKGKALLAKHLCHICRASCRVCGVRGVSYRTIASQVPFREAGSVISAWHRWLRGRHSSRTECQGGRDHVLLGGMQPVREDVMGRVRQARAERVRHHRRQGEGPLLVQELARRRASP